MIPAPTLNLAAALPLLLLPWPVKLVVDHVIEGIPLGEQPLPLKHGRRDRDTASAPG